MSAELTRPLRLCFVSADYPVHVEGRDVVGGGMGAHAYTLANAVAALGHEITVVTQSDRLDEEFMEGPIRVLAIARGSRRQWKLGKALPVPWLQRSLIVRKALRRLQRRQPFDLIRFPDGYGEGFAYSYSPTAPFSVHLHGPASVLQRWDGRRIPPRRARVEAWMERRPAAKANLVIAGTRWFADQMSEEWGLEPGRIAIIRNPLDVRKFRLPDSDWRDESQTILFAGHVQWFKGASVLAAAVPIVLARCPGARFKFLGSDTRSAPDGGSMRSFLEARLAAAGVGSSVEFAEPVAHAQLVSEYHRSAALVLPSFREVYGNVVIEAMACGRPSIVTRTVGAAELIKNGSNGYVVEPDDPAALANAICTVLELPASARREMGMRARETVVESSAAERIAGATIAAYSQLLSTRQPAPHA
jgi:glycogen synthase